MILRLPWYPFGNNERCIIRYPWAAQSTTCSGDTFSLTLPAHWSSSGRCAWVDTSHNLLGFVVDTQPLCLDWCQGTLTAPSALLRSAVRGGLLFLGFLPIANFPCKPKWQCREAT